MTKTRRWLSIGGMVVLGFVISCCVLSMLFAPKQATPKSGLVKTQTLEPTNTVQPTRTRFIRPTRTVKLTSTALSTSVATKVVAPITSESDARPCKVGQIKGNPNAANGEKIYHLPTWRLYKKLQNSDVICFDTIQDASNAGYRASKVK
jgi:hypothetical protein